MDVWQGALRRIFDSSARRHSEGDYELLLSDPNGRVVLPMLSNGGSSRRRSPRGFLFGCLHFFTIRRTLTMLSLVPFLLVLIVLWSGIPPSFDDIRTFERNLPQHNLTTAAAAGGMYLRFPDHLWGHGLNNILQET
jgi:hypothetical protein